MNILFGIWLGDFGYEVVNFAPFVRKLSKTIYKGDNIFVASSFATKVLYHDFAQFIKVDGLSNLDKNGAYAIVEQDKYNKALNEVATSIKADKIIQTGASFPGFVLGHPNYSKSFMNIGYHKIPDPDVSLVPDEVKEFVERGNLFVISPRNRGSVDTERNFTGHHIEACISNLNEHNIIINGVRGDVFGSGNSVIDQEYHGDNVLDLSKFYDDNFVNTQVYVLRNCGATITTNSGSMNLAFLNRVPTSLYMNTKHMSTLWATNNLNFFRTPLTVTAGDAPDTDAICQAAKSLAYSNKRTIEYPHETFIERFVKKLDNGSKILVIGQRDDSAWEWYYYINYYLQNFQIDVLDIFEDNYKLLAEISENRVRTRLMDKDIPGVDVSFTPVLGDVRQHDFSKYDAVMWIHGPEHLDKPDADIVIDRICNSCPNAILICPNVLIKTDTMTHGPRGGNMWETHRSAITPSYYDKFPKFSSIPLSGDVIAWYTTT